MQLNCQSLGCQKCCETYWITLLPHEAKTLAKSQNLSLSQFLQKKCLLDLQLFPSETSQGLSFPTNRLNQKTQDRILEYFGFLPQNMLGLPGVALKRKPAGQCTFLAKNGLCNVYDHRPNQCRLFPFISYEKQLLHETYRFCAFLQAEKPKTNPFENDQREQAKTVAAYFNQIEKNGLRAVWSDLPAKGNLRLGGTVIGKLSKKELLSYQN